VPPSDNSNKRHRKPNAADPAAQARAEELEKEEQQEQQVETEQEQQRDTQQDQMGNQGVAAMLGIPSVKPGSAGLGIEIGDRGLELESDLDYGGDDDDIPTDGPLTLRDLTREWNKGTQRGRDITSFSEPMPAEDLPAEDHVLAEAIRDAVPPDDLPRFGHPDALLQPTPSVVAGDMGPWLREAMRWAGPDLGARSLGHLVLPAAPALQDPSGRVLFARARAGALATLLMLDGPVLRDAPSPAATAFVDLCLELAGQRHTLLSVWWRAQQAQLKLPIGADIARLELQGRRTGRGATARLPDTIAHHLEVVLRDLIDLPSAKTLVPHVPEVPRYEADEDDPLGLDDILAEHTGGRPDPLASIYANTILGAERLASAVARTRVRFAGLAVALADVGDQWVAGGPVEPALALVAHADTESQRILTLLVEIAQAARRRAVDPQGIRNGLRRAAKLLDKVVTTTLRSMARLTGALLPDLPDLPPIYTPPPDDGLAGAWADGTPREALPWLARQPEGLDRDAAELFTRLGAGQSPGALAAPLRRLADRADVPRPQLAEAARVVAGACCLWGGDHDGALVLAQHQQQLGRQRRNGLLMAAGTLLEIEVHHAKGDFAEREAVRFARGVDAWHMGQRAGLSLLLRWEEPESPDDLMEAAFA